MTDIFTLANQIEAHRHDLDFDLYAITKSFMVYSVRLDPEVKAIAKATMINGLVDKIHTANESGTPIISIHDVSDDKNAIELVEVEEVVNAQSVFEQIDISPEQITRFDHSEVGVENITGFVGRFTFNDTVFHIIKAINKSNITKATAFAFDGDRFTQFDHDSAIQMPVDDQMISFDGRIYSFNTKKLESLFKFNAKRAAILNAKLAAVKKHFKIATPDGLEFDDLARSNVAVGNQIIKSQPESITQDRLIEQADRFGLPVMTDDAGAVIIMDSRDAMIFANLINDDYVDSELTGTQYVAEKKKPVDQTVEKQINLNI